MKNLLFCLFAFLVFTTPVIAQEDADKVLAETTEEKDHKPDEENYEERLELSKKMHEIWPVRPKVEASIDAVGEQVPEAERARFKAAMRRAMKFKALEEESINAMAEIFTVAELKAMIDFYGSKEGRSIAYKTEDYEAALRPLMVKMVDKALLDTRLGTQ